ncbi:MAG: nucleotide sugar dehydrogenase [Candidatus Eremiobacteraeota bacterium]|nr:nucleotide sugar dehydrogenase [Candidatus Eremiobacteraeota bacterium]
MLSEFSALPFPVVGDGENRPLDLIEKIRARTAKIGILGLGYVGLPLAAEFAKYFETFGLDIDEARVHALVAGRSYIGDVPTELVAALVESAALIPTADFSVLAECDCIIICVPTPLEAGKQPDISYIVSAAQAIAKTLRPGQLIVLESTTYPGTTEETLLPMFLDRGLLLDEDFLLAFSPERVDPGNADFKIADIPKIVGGCSELSTRAAGELYRTIVPFVHPVSSPRVAETAKLWENTFRAVNIALANEMALLCYHLGIDTTEVIAAAATKPFGFMPFYPGPGVGGHCIPLDPHYLSWTASKYGYYPRFIMLADEINSEMTGHVIELVGDALNDDGIAMRGAHVLVLGVSYKADVEDIRMSPAIPIIERLRAKGCVVEYHDPFVSRIQVEEAELPPSRRRDLRAVAVERRQHLARDLAGFVSTGRRCSDPLESSPLTDAQLEEADCVLVLTAHSCIDYARIARIARLVVDTRHTVPKVEGKGARLVAL